MIDSPVDGGLKFSLLDEPLIRYRKVVDGAVVAATLPQLFVALGGDEVRDYPALRPHQRHPWHAFLVQLAAIALHAAGRDTPFGTADEWRSALLSLTPNDADGAAWCLVSPPNRPALLQAPVPDGRVDGWTTQYEAPDELDMLITSKNHDLKLRRATRASPDDWIYALVSLQTQEGYGGRDNFGVARMAGGFGTRAGVGVAPDGHCGARWLRDVGLMRKHRAQVINDLSFSAEGGIALLWLSSWDGAGIDQVPVSRLDPFFIEICRAIRIGLRADSALMARSTTTKKARIDAGERQGVVGDLWTPIDVLAKPFGAALKIRAGGFDYRLTSALLFGTAIGGKGYEKSFTSSPALRLEKSDQNTKFVAVLQGISRGGAQGNKSATEGYHERRIPLSPKVRGLLFSQRRDVLALASSQRISLINGVRGALWSALALLFNNGVSGREDSIKHKANDFARPFEKGEDARFFFDLTDEIESEDPVSQRMIWQIGLVDRAEAILKIAFERGPRSGMQRYRAQSSALSMFHGTLLGPNSPLPDLAHHYREQTNTLKENSHDHA
jgi:CRISPR system Cascade subunit CasA